jgi:hypothetical protein
VRVVWNTDQAFRQTTPTRGRICLNGLWRWQPAAANDAPPLAAGWGYFKVPGSWPGTTDYMQKDTQRVYRHAAWRDTVLREVRSAWYEREFKVPITWSGRSISLSADCLNSFAAVYLDDVHVGDLRFPGGTLDLTQACRAGQTHRLRMCVTALPLDAVRRSYADTASVKEVQARVERRGLCGDVFLESAPPGARLGRSQIATSVRAGTITIRSVIAGANPGTRYVLAARIRRGEAAVAEFKSAPQLVDPDTGIATLSAAWKPTDLWDIDTPEKQFEAELVLQEESGGVLDACYPARFGFRELWIDGRDFVLNGTRVFLSAVPLDNAQVSAAAATYEAARESLLRLKTLGINFVYTHNYGCEPGAHLAFEEILRAADDVGMLVALTAPHFGQYDWKTPGAEATNGYAQHAAYYVGVAGNHPSVVFYATSHNAAGYNEDMNPDLLDGTFDQRDSWSANNAQKALRAEALLKRLDPERVVYHHASGNLGAMHSVNFYPNFVPPQELSDWFGPWASSGRKPLFLCEYGAPFTWDWAMYRGWYRGRREFGSAAVPWEFCLAEWNAQFLGDRAFDISQAERRNLRWEAEQFRAGRTWHRWDYPHQLGSADFPEREPILARYYRDNWRAFRTWGLSGTSPWEHHILFTLRPAVKRNQPTPLPVDWEHLQRPGFSPDFLGDRMERMDMAYERGDWEPTLAAEALRQNNGPFLAWIAGKAEAFTSKDHIFSRGERFAKQLILINSSRRKSRVDARWGLDGPLRLELGSKSLEIEPGQQVRVPLDIEIPRTLNPGPATLVADVRFTPGIEQRDAFAFHVLPDLPAPHPGNTVALFDPKGETSALLKELKVAFTPVDSNSDLSRHEILIVGKSALTIGGAAPTLERVADGLKVVVFEQSAEALERRLGFRVASYGLREVFPRIPDHPVLAGLESVHLADWRGEATLLPPRLQYRSNPKFNGAPTVSWCDIDVTRAWRCGCRGNVASVLIEKPASGDFLPLIDGGFGLQYSPLMEYREGAGLVVFCQMDVTGRTEMEPAARALVLNLLHHVRTWKPRPTRVVRYLGGSAGLDHLKAAGVTATRWEGGPLNPQDLLVLAAGGEPASDTERRLPTDFLSQWGCILRVGTSQADSTNFWGLGTRSQEYTHAMFPPPAFASPLAGIGPADVFCRAPRTLGLQHGGDALALGGGVLAASPTRLEVFCALAPWDFNHPGNYGLKRTFRRTSSLLARLLGNLGVQGRTPLLRRWAVPPAAQEPGRWLAGLYLDTPEEWDDPYRFFRW